MKINITSKKGIVLLALFVMMSCGGAKSSDNGLNTEEKKEVKTSTSQGETATKKESKSYEEELKERMDPIEAKLNKIIESGENMLSASFEEKEWFEKEEKKIKKELLDDGLSEGDRDYEMLFASHRAGLVKKRAMELAQKYDELSK